LRQRLRPVRGDYVLDDQDATIWGQPLCTEPEQRRARLVAPVVDDVFHHVGVAAPRDGLEAVAAHDLAALFDAPPGEEILRSTRGLPQSHNTIHRARIGMVRHPSELRREARSLFVGFPT